MQRRKFKTQKKIIISLFITLLCISFGYAAFRTNINLSAKGNIYKISDKCFETSDNGDGTVTITNYDKNCGSEVNIPSTIKGKTVTEIGNTGWNEGKSFNQKSLTKVTIPNTVKSIGSEAFSYNDITSLTLNEGLETIGWAAFFQNKLTYINIPNSVKNINEIAFAYNNLTEYNIPDNLETLGGGAFANNNFKGNNAFIYQITNGITNNTILNSYGNHNVSNIEIPSNINEIATFAFRNTYITDLEIPSTVKTIKYRAFEQASIQNIKLNNGLTTIEYLAFNQVWNLNEITIPDTIETVGIEAFAKTPIKTININKKQNAIEGAPWGATNAAVNWTGTD